MTLSENIAKYRKQMGYTQEKLGELLGVTNQAVSKWELGISMPDVMLLPKIADVLGTTLNGLYGIEDKTEPTNQGLVTADEFPKAANDMLIEYFVKQSGFRFTFTESEEANVEYHKKKINETLECVLGCISDEAGSVFVSKDMSFINTDYKTVGSENIFVKREILSSLKKFSDPKVGHLYAYMYNESFLDNETPNKCFLVSSTAQKCDLSEDECIEVFEKLCSMNLLETYVNADHITEYFFLKSRAVFVLAAFKLLEKMSMDFVYNVMRDTSTISDYAFEKLWK